MCSHLQSSVHVSLCVALFSWWIWEVNTPPSLELCFRCLPRRNPRVSFGFLLSLPCTNSFSLCASSWLIGGQRRTQWCCSEDKNQLLIISWVLMTDVLPLFSFLAFSSTILKHFTNVTYVDLVGKKARVSGENCKFDLEWWSQYWRAEISWPTPLGLLIFLRCCSGFLKAFVKKMTIPSEVSRFFFFLPMHFQGAFSDLLNFVLITTWALYSAVWLNRKNLAWKRMACCLGKSVQQLQPSKIIAAFPHQ